MAGMTDSIGRWQLVKEMASADNLNIATLLSSAVLEGDDGEALTISVPRGSGFIRSQLEPGHEARTVLDNAVADAFGTRSIIICESDAVEYMPPKLQHGKEDGHSADAATGQAEEHVERAIEGAGAAPSAAEDEQNVLQIVEASAVTGDNTRPLRAPLIDGILREGGKLAIIGPPKSHKSMEAIQLGLCLATGRSWRGHRCMRTKVLYINVELMEDEFYKRCDDVRRALGIDPGEYAGMLSFLTLTGRTIDGGRPTFETVRGWLEMNVSRGEFGCIVIDPLYKIVDGDENSAGDVNRMLYELDMLRAELDCTIFYVHHTAKGGSAYKTVFELGRGSSNFGGDADAVIGISELTVPKDSDAWRELEDMGIANPAGSAYEMQFGLRSFADPAPVRLLKVYPRLLEVDGILDGLHLRGDSQAKGGEANRQRVEDENRMKQDAVAAAVAACIRDGNEPTRRTVHAAYLRAECFKRGVHYPENIRSFERWTRPGGCTTYRVDPETFCLFDGAADE